MIQDDHKGIIVSYNFLNLPVKVTKTATGESIEWLYDAGGNKLINPLFPSRPKDSPPWYLKFLLVS